MAYASLLRSLFTAVLVLFVAYENGNGGGPLAKALSHSKLSAVLLASYGSIRNKQSNDARYLEVW